MQKRMKGALKARATAWWWGVRAPVSAIHELAKWPLSSRRLTRQIWVYLETVKRKKTGKLACWSSSAICAANEGGCSCGVGGPRDRKFTCLTPCSCWLLHCIETSSRPSRAVVIHRGRLSKNFFLGETSSLRLNIVNYK